MRRKRRVLMMRLETKSTPSGINSGRKELRGKKVDYKQFGPGLMMKRMTNECNPSIYHLIPTLSYEHGLS
jgi:hypothetical protein